MKWSGLKEMYNMVCDLEVQEQKLQSFCDYSEQFLSMCTCSINAQKTVQVEHIELSTVQNLS